MPVLSSDARRKEDALAYIAKPGEWTLVKANRLLRLFGEVDDSASFREKTGHKEAAGAGRNVNRPNLGLCLVT